MNTEEKLTFISGLSIGILIGGLLFLGAISLFMGTDYIHFEKGDLRISNITANIICSELTNNSIIQAQSEDGKLICYTPTYDNTQNIIIKSNGER